MVTGTDNTSAGAGRRLDAERLEKAAHILKCVAHPLRLAIVDLLGRHDSLSVGDICAELDSEQSLVSHHLSTMKSSGLIGAQRSGKNMMYFLRERDILKIFDCLENCNCNIL